MLDFKYPDTGPFWKLYTWGYFWHFGCFGGFIVGGLSQVDLLIIIGLHVEESRTKRHRQKNIPLSTIFVLPRGTHQDTSVSSSNVSSIHWQCIWSRVQKFNSRTHVFVAMLQFVWIGFGKAIGKERETISSPAYKVFSIQAQIQWGLHFKCFAMTFWKGKY